MSDDYVIKWGEPGKPVSTLKKGQVPRRFTTYEAATKEANRLNATAIAKEVPWRYFASTWEGDE